METVAEFAFLHTLTIHGDAAAAPHAKLWRDGDVVGAAVCRGSHGSDLLGQAREQRAVNDEGQGVC